MSDWLAEIGSFIQPHMDDKGHTKYLLQLGEGWQMYPLADELPEVVRDAINCQCEIGDLMDLVGADDQLAGDLTRVVGISFKLGQLSEKMKVRRFEPFALSGKRHLEGARAGGKGTAKLDEGQWSEVMATMQAKTAAGLSAAVSSRQISAQLLTKQFFEDRSYDITANSIAKRWSKRGIA